MKFSSLLRREAVVVAFMCLFVGLSEGPLIGQSTPALFSEVGPANDQGAPPAGTRRARRAALRADLLASALQPGTDARPAFVLNLFADVRLRIERERLERDGRGHVSWVGHVQGDPNSTVALTWNGTAVKGGVVAYGSAFEISPSAGGLTLIVERDLTQAPVELPARPVPPGRRPGDELGDRVAPDAFTANIDILVLYTPAARMKVGGASHLQIQAEIASAVAATNTAYQRSGVNAALRAVGVTEFPYVEAPGGLGDDLAVMAPGGSANGPIESVRNSMGADLVAIITGRASASSGCGIGYLGPNAAYEFTVTEQECLFAGQWSFTHELGHNAGADHAPGDPISSTAAAYARGYRAGAIRTLMAYFVTGSANARILNYSSSTVLEAGAATGNVSQDNARRLRETVATLAAYRAAAGGGTLPAAPTGLAANVVGTSVTVSWAAVATATAYVLDVGTAPGDSSLGSFTVPGTSAAGAVPPGTYYWRVRAQNSAGTGPPSAESTFVVAGATPPGPPTSFVASAVSTTVTLSWLAPTTGGAVTGYELGVGFTPGASNLLIPLSTSPVAFAGVAPGTYYLRLKSVGPGGQSAPTPEVPLTVSSACTPPGTPTITGTVVAGTVSLAWTTPTGTAPFTYSLAVGSAPGLVDIGVFPMGGANSFIVAPPPRSYFVKVSATNACGTSPLSSDILITVP